MFFAISFYQCNSNSDITPETIISSNTVITYQDFCRRAEELNFLKQKKIIGIGEVVHGSSTIKNINHAFVKFLIDSMGFKNIFLEYEFHLANKLNRLVRSNKDTIKVNHIWQHQSSTHWFLQNGEFIELINWIKRYNNNHEEFEKVSFYGIDMQFRAGAIKYIYDFLQNKKPKYIAYNKEKVKTIMELEYQDLPDSLLIFISKIDSLINTIENISKREYDLIKYNINLLKQTNEFLADKNDAGINFSTIRDKFMFANFEWIKKNYAQNKTANSIILAHNYHISYGERCGLFNIICNKSMGGNIKTQYGNNYLAIGSEFGYGQFYARNTNTQTFGVNKILKSQKSNFLHNLSRNYNNSLTDLRTKENIPLMNKKANMHAIGTLFHPKRLYDKITPNKHFDILLYTEHIKPSSNLW